jgi:hypothetical protein
MWKRATNPHWRRLPPLVAAVAVSCCVTLPVCATTLLRLNLNQLARAAGAIALVRCDSSSASIQGRAVWTTTQFSQIESFKGALPARFSVRLPGGRAGHIIETIESVPRFRVGETGVLFLQELDGGGYSITGWALGTFRIRPGDATRESTVTQDSSAVALFDPTSRRFVTEGIRDLPLSQFRRRLGAALGGNAPSGAPR